MKWRLFEKVSLEKININMKLRLNFEIQLTAIDI